MIFNIKKDIKFSNLNFKMNIFSSIFIIFSLFIIVFKGLNFGVDFKGGTLIEARVDVNQITIGDIRQSLLKMNLGDVTVKKFGKEGDYLIKIEKSDIDDNSFIGSNSSLIAPIKIGKNVTIAAGSVIDKNVKSSNLAIERSKLLILSKKRRSKNS